MKMQIILPIIIAIIITSETVILVPLNTENTRYAASVNGVTISTDYLNLLADEGIIKLQGYTKKQIKQIFTELIDNGIDTILLCQEAKEIGLDTSPTTIQIIEHEKNHINILLAIKSRNPTLSLSEIMKKDLDELYNQLKSSILENTTIHYNDLYYVKTMVDTRYDVEQRKSIIVATANEENITLQDMLDVYPAYQEQHFVEWFITKADIDSINNTDNANQTIEIKNEYGIELIRNAVVRKFIKKDVEQFTNERTVYKEYITREMEAVLADCLCSLYLNANPDNFYRDEYTNLFIQVERPTPTDNDLLRYYEQNIEKFKTTDWIKVRHIMVETQEEMDAIVLLVEFGVLQTDAVVKRLARLYSVSENKEKDGDLGTIYNPGLYPDAEIPSVIPWYISMNLFDLEKDSFSKIYATEEGYHILYVYDGGETIAPYDTDWARYTAYVNCARELREAALDNKLNELRQNTAIDIGQLSELAKELSK